MPAFSVFFLILVGWCLWGEEEEEVEGGAVMVALAFGAVSFSFVGDIYLFCVWEPCFGAKVSE